MKHPLFLSGRFLASVLLITTGLSSFGCGDTATVSEPAELGNLSASNGTLQPPFNPATTSYTVQLSSDVSTTTISASPRVSGDTIRIDNQLVTSQTVTLNSPGAEQSVSIVVIDSGAGGGSKSYTVRVRRDVEDNSLLTLSVSDGILSPSPFEKDTLDYTVNSVDASATRITISATKSDPASIMQIGSVTVPAGIASGQATVDLGSTGATTPVEIVISRPSGSSRTYNVSINRGPSDNNNLGGIGISPGSLSPAFRANTTGYTVSLPATLANNVTSVRITPRLQDTTATMTVNGQTTRSGESQSTPLPGPGSRVSNSIVVIAQDTTSKIYTVDVIREALGANNDLSGLSIRAGRRTLSLSPSFDSDTLVYTVNVANDVSEVAVTATRRDANASITVNGQSTNSGQARTVTLNPAGQSQSTTTIPVVVMAQNGSQKTYTANVIRAALGGNADLSGLTVSSGTLNPGFTAAGTAYTVNGVSSSATSITVNATPEDSSATVEINNQGGNSRFIPLPGGPSDTVIEVRVIAPNGNAKTYRITVNQPEPAAPPAPAAPDLHPDSDSGISNTDNITNDLTPSFTVASPAAGETPRLYIDGNMVKEGFDQGANTLTPTNPLPSGEYDIAVTSTVTNAAGIESSPSEALTVRIDSVAPGNPEDDDDDD